MCPVSLPGAIRIKMQIANRREEGDFGTASKKRWRWRRGRVQFARACGMACGPRGGPEGLPSPESPPPRAVGRRRHNPDSRLYSPARPVLDARHAAPRPLTGHTAPRQKVSPSNVLRVLRRGIYSYGLKDNSRQTRIATSPAYPFLLLVSSALLFFAYRPIPPLLLTLHALHSKPLYHLSEHT